MLYPDEWLDEKAEGDAHGRTNREVQRVVSASILYVTFQLTPSQLYLRRIEITRPQTLVGSLSQMYAAMTHRVSAARLRQISATIPKVLITTGDNDHLVSPHKSRYIKQHMPEAEFLEMLATGHAIQIQQTERFNAALERTFEEGRQIVLKKQT